MSNPRDLVALLLSRAEQYGNETLYTFLDDQGRVASTASRRVALVTGVDRGCGRNGRSVLCRPATQLCNGSLQENRNTPIRGDPEQ